MLPPVETRRTVALPADATLPVQAPLAEIVPVLLTVTVPVVPAARIALPTAERVVTLPLLVTSTLPVPSLFALMPCAPPGEAVMLAPLGTKLLTVMVALELIVTLLVVLPCARTPTVRPKPSGSSFDAEVLPVEVLAVTVIVPPAVTLTAPEPLSALMPRL